MNIKKRGSWMTEETGRFILSIIVIIFLIMLVVYVVKIFQTNTEYEQAKSTLADIKEEINNQKVTII